MCILRTLNLFIWVFALGLGYCQSEGCDPGWFGSDCQYKCHCARNNCDSNGTCTGSSVCQAGWFGPACQYVDLASTGTVTTGQLTDGDDGTCNSDSASQTTTVIWPTPYPFTWMRIVVSNPDFLHQFNVALGNNSAVISPLTCTNSTVNKKTLDIHCNVTETVKQVTLTGEGVGTLCSIYISGGRNVALKQKATQSSTVYYNNVNWDASNAVDGDTDARETKVPYTCSATNDSSAPGSPGYSSWSVMFSFPQLVNRYILYNRRFSVLKWRLKGFTLTSFHDPKQAVFKYTDTETNPKDKYTILSPDVQLSVSSVRVNATEQRGLDANQKNITNTELTLCEVEIYGDNACSPEKYGLECDKDCNCVKKNEACYVSTGGCPSGCAAGYYGEGCKEECPPMFHGVDCKDTCRMNCLDQLCDRVSGGCSVCTPGKQDPPLCDKDCDASYYGPNCTLSCPETCGGDGSCDGKNATCSQGCKPGYIGGFCNETCPVNKTGDGCLNNCSAACAANDSLTVCDHVTGVCLYGCVGDPDLCPIPAGGTASDTDDRPTLPIALIAGVVAGAVLLILLIVVGVIFWRRRRSSKGQYGKSGETEENSLPRPKSKEPSRSRHASSAPETDEVQKGSPYYNTFTTPTATHAIAVKELSTFMATHTEDYFTDQFAQIPTVNKEATMTAALSDENKAKNRYKNISAYDHSRVHLIISRERNEEDYINASYVEGYKNQEKFIASQGPNKIMVNDFIRMLWEQKVDKVVMLTNLIEEGKTKCEQYWPEDGAIEFGEIKVRLAMTHVFADYTIRKLTLVKGNQEHLLTQFHFTSWPDKGTPTIPWSLVDFEQRVASYPTNRPIVVHCSAGIGRTGTFIALRNVMNEAEDTGQIDFYSIVLELRKDRVNMIQTAEQYFFLHKAAVVALICMGTTVTSSNIVDRIRVLKETSPSGQTFMEKEFEAICGACAESSQETDDEGSQDVSSSVYQNSRNDTNKNKNRFSNVLPKENYRATLICEIKDTDNYINAVLVPSFTKPNNQILTQLPLPSTVLDFYRLITQYRVSLVVAFEKDSISTDSTICSYLPLNEEEPLSCGPFTVETKPATSDIMWTEQALSIKVNKKDNASALLKAYQVDEHPLTHLSCTSTSLEPQSLLTTVEKVRSLSSRSKGVTLFMCRNGANYSGLVYVLSLLLDRMDNDLCLTVPLVVGAVKCIRPQVIPSVQQYKTLYDVLKQYHESANVYSNFGDSNRTQTKPEANPRIFPKSSVTNNTNEPHNGSPEENTNVYANTTV